MAEVLGTIGLHTTDVGSSILPFATNPISVGSHRNLQIESNVHALREVRKKSDSVG